MVRTRMHLWTDGRMDAMLITIFPEPIGWGIKTDFKDGHHGGNLGFQIRTILAIFDVQVTPMLLTKFQVNWPFSSGEEAINKFSRWPL